jgi:hypothetical protein
MVSLLTLEVMITFLVRATTEAELDPIETCFDSLEP